VDPERFYRSGEKKNTRWRQIKAFFERPTSNIEHRMMNSLRSAILLKNLACFIQNSMLDVGSAGG